MDHPGENTIVGYADGGLTREQRLQLEEHIDTCAECRQTLALFVADESPVTDLPKPGDRLADRFQIKKLIGQGGMGYVFHATDLDLGIDVAVKVLRPHLTRDEEQVRHLRREILTSRKISHPNVCRVFDLGKTERLHFITMELVAGTTLAERLRAGPIDRGAAIRIIEQLLSALASTHAEGIVHRDLKPANVMLEAGDKVKVMDFSLARDLANEPSLRGRVGTPAYWAPEQARGVPAGPAADVHAVGLLAYMLLVGETSPRKLRQRLGEVPADLRGWVERCVEADPADRFPDAGAAAAALITTGARSARWLPFVVGAAVLAIALGIWLGARGSSSRSAEPSLQPRLISIDASVDAPEMRRGEAH